MRHGGSVLICAVISLGLAVCSDDDVDQADTGVGPEAGLDGAAPVDGGEQPDAAAQADGSVSPGCDGLAEGLNAGFEVDGLSRSFVLNLPNDVDTGGPFAVVFSYHGLGDTMQNFVGLMASQVNHSALPFVLVTPA